MVLDVTNLSDDVAKYIRKRILNGELKPGEKITQSKLAQELKISRGPIREALSKLEHEGLVTHEVNKGTCVTTLSKKDAYEIYTLRGMLESEAAQLSVKHLTTNDYNTLNDILLFLEKALREKTVNLMAFSVSFKLTISTGVCVYLQGMEMPPAMTPVCSIANTSALVEPARNSY
nr:GntR family transcriptional regulator [Litchfieldia alkalitelluris]